MKLIISIAIAIFLIIQPELYSQTAPKLYAHKVTVDSAFQTRAYTYLRVIERIKEKDSILWMALPVIPAKAGDVLYYESGMAMGQFTSKELKRTFNQILFMASLSTTPEVNEKTILPAPVIDTVPKNVPPPVVHTVTAKEVLQAGGYTYLRVTEGKEELWIAVVKMEAKPGLMYHFEDPAMMHDFYSKELKRTFKEIFFLAKLTPGPAAGYADESTKKAMNADAKKKAKAMSQPSIAVNSIADLLENKTKYTGKKITIKGEVSKYSANILDKNWAHITDGTRFLGKGDMVITTDKTLKVGDKAIFEGILSVDQDFGGGYFFEVIIEDAIVH